VHLPRQERRTQVASPTMSSSFIACKSFVLSSSRSSFAAPFPLQHGPVQIKRRRGAAIKNIFDGHRRGQSVKALSLSTGADVAMRTNSQNSCPDAARTGLVKSRRLREQAFEGECHKQKEACHDRRGDHYSDHSLGVPLEDESIGLGCPRKWPRQARSSLRHPLPGQAHWLLSKLATGDVDRRCRGDVVAGAQVSRRLRQPIKLDQFAPAVASGEASAHGPW